ncbi:MAG: homoserine kinase [Thermoleophilia bacterium]
MSETLVVSAPATSANLGPGFDTLAVALDLSNAVVITRRPGPLTVRVTGEGSGEVPETADNLVCRAMAMGLGELDGLDVECRNRIPLGRGLGSSAAAVCAGLVAANALGSLRWSPADILGRAAELEGHADNAAACLDGGLVAVGPTGMPAHIAPPAELVFVAAIPGERVSTEMARKTLPATVSMEDAAATVSSAIALTLALRDGRLHRVAAALDDRLHEPHRAPLIPGIDVLRGLTGTHGCLGVTISGSGPTVLLWCRADDAEDLAAAAGRAMTGAGHADVRMRVSRMAPTGVRARWTGGTGSETRLERSIG